MENNNLILNKIFTKNTLRDLLENQQNNDLDIAIKRYLTDSVNLNNGEVISQIYKFMLKSYKNEYVYKNTLLNKLLLGKYSANTTTAIVELPIEKSKADFILVNKKGIVYEIKTELDNLERLDGQIEDYYKVFTQVCVITSENDYYKVYKSLVGTTVGICVLTKRNTISVRKQPSENFGHLNLKSMFKVLRKGEYESIILKHFGYLPDVRPVEYYRECLSLFQKIEVKKAYSYMLQELKKRNYIEIQEFKEKVPFELKSLVYFSDFKTNDYILLEAFLNKKYRG